MFAADVLKEDFKEALSKIDFEKEYDPYDKYVMKATLIGALWLCVKSADEEDDVGEELDGARKYWRWYLEKGDQVYKEMAADELRHAGILIKKRMANATNETKREWLNALEKERQEMLKAVSSPKID